MSGWAWAITIFATFGAIGWGIALVYRSALVRANELLAIRDERIARLLAVLAEERLEAERVADWMEAVAQGDESLFEPGEHDAGVEAAAAESGASADPFGRGALDRGCANPIGQHPTGI
jgi:hypothetical protein